MWGLDLVVPLQKAPGGFTHLLVAIDKFSKWIETRPIGKIKSEQALLFFTDIVFRFGVPNSIIIDNGLHKRSPSGVLQRCIPIPEGKELIRDIHAGICGHHAASRTLFGNAFRQGFYWPTTVADATDVV